MPIAELTRNAVDVLPAGGLEQKLKLGRPLRVKLGIDVTSPDIHVGRAIPLQRMRAFQNEGHTGILIIGDYTTRIGDPSGRSAERPILSDDEIDASAQTYLEQAMIILDPERTEVRHNGEWLSKLTYAEVVRLARTITVARMLERDDFAKRYIAGGLDKYPPIIARGVLLDVAGMHGVDCLSEGYAITPKDLQDCAAQAGVELRKKDVVLVRSGRMTVWPDFDGYLLKPPGINLPAAKWLCEEAGAMCIAGDSIGLEVMPWDEPDAFLPVHAYMFATAGAQIIEVVDMEEIAAEKQYEFAFLGFPMKLRGATGAPMPSYAVPLRT